MFDIYFPIISEFGYSLDQKELIEFSPQKISEQFVNWDATLERYRRNETVWWASLSLIGLEDGPNRIIVEVTIDNVIIDMPYAHAKTAIFATASDYFRVDVQYPIINIKSPQNATYSSASIPLNFEVSTATSQICYSIDDQSNTTILANTTLTELSDGVHRIVIYAHDMVGNVGKSDTVNFTVYTSTTTSSPSSIPSPSQSPTLEPTIEPSLEPTQTQTIDGNQTVDLMPILVLTGIAVITVAVGALVYFKKNKK